MNMISTEHRYQLPTQAEITQHIGGIISYNFALGSKIVTIYHNTDRNEVLGEFTRNGHHYEITGIYVDGRIGVCDAFSSILNSVEKTECLKFAIKLPMRTQVSSLPPIGPHQIDTAALFIKSCAGEYSIKIDSLTTLKINSNHFGVYTYQVQVAKIFDVGAIQLFTIHPDQVEFYKEESKIEAICLTCLKRLSEASDRGGHQVIFDLGSVPVLVKLRVEA